MIRSEVVSGVLLLMACCVKCSMKRRSISRIVLDGVLVNAERSVGVSECCS